MAAGQDVVLVAVAAGEVDREAPGVQDFTQTQAAQRQYLATGQYAVDVGEGSPVADFDSLQLRPVGACVLVQALAEVVLHRLGRGLGHASRRALWDFRPP